MPGMQVKVSAAVSGSAFQTLQPDSILPSKGALILIDPTHPLSPWAPGVPGHNSEIPNIAAAQAKLLVGSADADVMPTVYNTGAHDGAAIIRARSSKGGLRAKGNYLGLRPSVKTADYLIANAGHSFYVSLYSKFNETDPNNYQLFSIRSGPPTSTTLVHIAIDGSTSPSTSDERYLGHYKAGDGSNVAVGRAHHAAAFQIGIGNFAAGVTGQALISNNQVALFGTYANNKAVDRTTYGFYMEDLTVSGRTFAEVLALDKARYAKLFAPGGRYDGDV